MPHLLDNLTWHALAGAQARYAAGTGAARRYARGFSAIVGFAEPERPDFSALVPHCDPGEHFYCVGWSGPSPADWHIETEAAIVKMIWDGALPAQDDVPQTLQLGIQHVAQAMELTALTRPGPFGPRTLELGEYFGCFEGTRLLAMAGERLHAGTLREVSGVCTHPDAQGRGLARGLMTRLIRRQLQRGETPCLHVMHENTGARRLYERMGFRDHLTTVARVVALG